MNLSKRRVKVLDRRRCYVCIFFFFKKAFLSSLGLRRELLVKALHVKQVWRDSRILRNCVQCTQEHFVAQCHMVCICKYYIHSVSRYFAMCSRMKKIYFYKNKSQSNSVKRATSNLLTLHPLGTKYFCEIFAADFFSVAGKSFAFVSILITHFSLLPFWTSNVAITLRPIYVKKRTMNGGGSMYVPAMEKRRWQNVNL